MFGLCCERQRKNSDTWQSDEGKYLERTRSENSRHDHDLLMILDYEEFIEDLEEMMDRNCPYRSTVYRNISDKKKTKGFRKKIKALKKKHSKLRGEVMKIHVTH